MGLLDDVGGILRQYAGGGAQPPADVHTHFDQVSAALPAGSIANGLANVFRSDQTPDFAQMVGGLFSQSNGAQKAGVLNQLLGALGPAAVAQVLGGGALAGMLGGGSVTPEVAQKIPVDAVTKLATHAQGANGSIVDAVAGFYAQHPTLVKSIGAGALALLMSKLSARR